MHVCIMYVKEIADDAVLFSPYCELSQVVPQKLASSRATFAHNLLSIQFF